MFCYTSSGLRRLIRYFTFFGFALRRGGARATLEWSWFRFRQLKGYFGMKEPPWNVRPSAVMHPLTVRRGRTSDLRVFEQIFLLDEYYCLRDVQEVSLVLDLGANVGFSSAYFLSSFPHANLVAVEPDAGNCAVCAANLAPYGNRAVLMRGAVWSRRTKLRVSESSRGMGDEWGRRMEEAPQSDAAIDAWDIGSLMDITGFQKADLVKIDIEGSEAAVFGNEANTAWLSRTRNVCIELHGRECKDAFFKALKGFEYDLSYSHELTICRNLRARNGVSADEVR
jgi:FkbM family methyltransferase